MLANDIIKISGPSNVGSILGELGGIYAARISSPWAILMVQFNDQTDAWAPMSLYQDLFTSAGVGKMNMVDFFRDMSHGALDLSGTQLFGPYTLPAKLSDYKGTTSTGTINKGDRNQLLDLAKNTASNDGANLSNFAGVCVTCLGQVDLCGWVGGMAALCDTLSLEPSALGQEMGHGYGLDHARLGGSPADYQDPWDIMSTFNAYMAPNSEFTVVGPGMNAWEMRSRAWLDETRVWTNPAASFDSVAELRPLHRTDLPGFLAAEVGSPLPGVPARYLVEFRVPDRWDAAIPRACILVHSFLDNHSYLMYSYSGSRDIVKGDKFVFGDPNYPILGYFAAEVKEIDVPNLTATIALHQRPEQPINLPAVAGGLPQVFPLSGMDSISLGDRVFRIPSYGSARTLLEQFARYLQIEVSANNVEVALTARRLALEEVALSAGRLYKEAAQTDEQPPGYPWHPPGSQHKFFHREPT